jgi:hypothetical protein
MEQLCRVEDENGPFYLVHPDLHANNVIINPDNYDIIGILDWEGACTLPFASSCVPPICLFIGEKDELVPKSEMYTEFETRVDKYVSELEKKTSTSIEKGQLTLFPSSRMKSCVSDKTMFFVWALDDIRYLDQLLWQHLAPNLWPDLRSQLEETLDAEGTAPLRDRIHKVLDSFVQQQLSLPPFNTTAWRSWLEEKLVRLKNYDRLYSASGINY